MSELRQINVDPLPRLTWHWCKVNDVSVKVCDEGVVSADLNVVLSENVTDTTVYTEEEYRKLESGMGEAFAEYGYKVSAKTDSFRADDPDKEGSVMLNLGYDKDRWYFNSFRLEAADNCNMTVIMRYKENNDDMGSTGGEPQFHAGVDTRVHVGKKAKIRLIQIHESENSCIYNNVASNVEDSGKLEIIHVVLKGREVYNGCISQLEGKRSTLEINMGYIAETDAKIDINYVARHIGRESVSDILANGVLNKGARKCFRSTVDFITGCPGSKGAEKEDVLLLDDDVVNKTVPLILCTEEDVEGEHGATIGKLSDEILFYLNTRGVDEKLAYKLMSTGKIASIVRLIGDNEITKEILDDLEAK
ncbi:MAG: SufD family Fe-S cluster assembly protein [Lachnospiraceae bacterium]|nr:SufD family Fe-S cluster assembly protein [Lachnospiraceae bacterium]